jgi:DNA (cytosine-5)-methyltransferase 1
LFFEITRILADKRPKAFFLENVRHILNHDNGNTFATIRSMIGELWYSFTWKVVKASDFWLPQFRPRIYFVGFDKNLLVENAPDFEFPKPIPLKMNMSDIFGEPCSREIGFTLRVGGKWSKIEDRRNWDSYLVNGKARRINSREGRKMMGFPDDFMFPVTESQAMKQLWNSVAVPAIYATAEAMLKYMSKNFSNQ